MIPGFGASTFGKIMLPFTKIGNSFGKTGWFNNICVGVGGVLKGHLFPLLCLIALWLLKQ